MILRVPCSPASAQSRRSLMTARCKAAAQIMRKPIASLLYMALKSRTTQRAVNSRAVWRRRTSMASTMGVIMKIRAAGIPCSSLLGCFRHETKPPAFPGAPRGTTAALRCNCGRADLVRANIGHGHCTRYNALGGGSDDGRDRDAHRLWEQQARLLLQAQHPRAVGKKPG